MTGALTGKVIALAGTGSERDRAVAMACAEAGADVAFGTSDRSQEFAMASIANEVWAVGREQFVRVLDACDPVAVTAWADEVWDRLGRCDVLVTACDAPSGIPLDELAHAEFVTGLERNLAAPFLAAQAFGRLMERSHGGLIVLLAPASPGDAACRAAAAGLSGLAAAINESWAPESVRAVVVEGASPGEAAAAVLAAL